MSEEIVRSGENQPVTLETRVIKIQFYLGQIGQGIIEVGKELIECKKVIPHGEWGNWLKENFGMTHRTADRFMKVADRFSNWTTSSNIDKLTNSQMLELLALPEGDEEKFIAAKAAEGKPVEDMTIKNLRAEIKEWKGRAETLEAEYQQLGESVKTVNEEASKYRGERDKLAAELTKLQSQKPITVEKVPDDYAENKRELETLRQKISDLQEKLDAKTVETVPPADYEETKKQLAELQANCDKVSEDIDVAQKLDAIFSLITDIVDFCTD